MRTLVVSAADEAFVPLLRGMLGSIMRFAPLGDLALFDVGLGPESRAALARQVHHLATPGWDLPVAEALRTAQPHLRALTVRPFLREHFPGYDKYLWIDADAWVQERSALAWYLAVAQAGRLAITPQVDRAYRHLPQVLHWRVSRMRSYFGDAAAERSLWEPYYNAGVFCLEATAPHWQVWAAHFRSGLEATGGSMCCDQTALNHAIASEGLATHPLPALCNWLCHLATPYVHPQTGTLCEPFAPRQAIGIVHLSAQSKDTVVTQADAQHSPVRSLRSPYDGLIGVRPGPGAYIVAKERP